MSNLFTISYNLAIKTLRVTCSHFIEHQFISAQHHFMLGLLVVLARQITELIFNNKVLLSVQVIQKRLKTVFSRFCIEVRSPQFFIMIFAVKVKLNYHSNIVMHLDITNYSKIASHILEIIELRKRDKGLAFPILSLHIFLIQIEGVLSGFSFLMTRFGSAMQTLPLQSSKEITERFSKLHKKCREFSVQLKIRVRLLRSFSLWCK